MEFMKLMEPAQLMEGLIFIELIYLIKLKEPMKKKDIGVFSCPSSSIPTYLTE